MTYGKISKKQQEILEYIKSEILNRGFPPAVREICEAVNLKSTSSVHAHLEALEKNGYIKRVSVERDARLKKIELTEAGIKFHDNIEISIDSMEERLVVGLSKQQKKDLFAMLSQIKKQLEVEIASDGEKIGKEREK